MAISLFTSGKLPIINDLARLSNIPVSGIFLGQAIVYADSGELEDHDGVGLVQINGVFYAQFTDGARGCAVVSYLIG